jgi:hypothetical protein
MWCGEILAATTAKTIKYRTKAKGKTNQVIVFRVNSPTCDSTQSVRDLIPHALLKLWF